MEAFGYKNKIYAYIGYAKEATCIDDRKETLSEAIRRVKLNKEEAKIKDYKYILSRLEENSKITEKMF